MARRPQGERTAVTVCHGCCCGTLRKHPETDSRAQRERLLTLQRQLPRQVRVQVSDCLDSCAQSNVMLVRPSPAGRRKGARPVWLGQVLDEPTLDAVAQWLRAGGPGIADLPSPLQPHVFRPSRHAQTAAGS